MRDHDHECSASPVLEVFLLGGVRLRVGDRELSDQGSSATKLWSVLCYLILNRAQPCSQSGLIDLFWANEEQSDPAAALKVLVSRIRRLLAPLLGDTDTIIGRRGMYQWNPDITCQVDVERFQSVCHQAETDDPASRSELLREAVALYQGDLLPRFSGQRWLFSLNEWTRSLYVKAVLSYASILEDAGQYEQMETVCLKASAICPLDERLYTLGVRALFLQEKYADAMRYYNDATALLYNELGVRPSEQMQKLYERISLAQDASILDFSALLSEMAEHCDIHGALFCEFSIFKTLYQLELRRAPRNGACLYMALLTLSTPDGSPPAQSVVDTLMEGLLVDIQANLRYGDVISRCGANQYIIMLPSSNLEDSISVMDRISAAVREHLRASMLRLSYQLRALGEL